MFDCAERLRRRPGRPAFPNEAYNLGSENPPPVRELLGDLIKHAGSQIDPAADAGLAGQADARRCSTAVNMPIMDPEQYLIADEMCILDTSKAKRELGWRPQLSRRGHAARRLHANTATGSAACRQAHAAAVAELG